MNRDKLLSVIAELELEDEKSKKLLEEVHELDRDWETSRIISSFALG